MKSQTITPGTCVSYKNGETRATVISVDYSNPLLPTCSMIWHDTKETHHAAIADLRENPIVTLEEFRQSKIKMSAKIYNSIYGHQVDDNVLCYDGAYIHLYEDNHCLAIYNRTYSDHGELSLSDLEEILWDEYAKWEGGSRGMTKLQRHEDMTKRLSEFKEKYQVSFNNFLNLDTSLLPAHIQKRANYLQKEYADVIGK